MRMSHLRSESTSQSKDHILIEKIVRTTLLSFSSTPNSQKLCDIINVYYLKSLSIGVICYWAVANKYMWSQNYLCPRKLVHFFVLWIWPGISHLFPMPSQIFLSTCNAHLLNLSRETLLSFPRPGEVVPDSPQINVIYHTSAFGNIKVTSMIKPKKLERELLNEKIQNRIKILEDVWANFWQVTHNP